MAITSFGFNRPLPLTTFNYLSNAIRVIQIDGQPWFDAANVCRTLGLTNASVAVLALDTDEWSKRNLALKGMGAAIVVSEPGLYKLISRSNKPDARSFDRWVRHEVLPAIRKDGAYIMGEEKVRTGEMDEDELVLRAVAAIAPIVENKLGRTVTNSRAVAEFFGKRRDNVLRDIDNILASGHSDLRGLFVECNDYHDQARKMVRSFDMTKDGFVLLAMGFTGPKALAFKLAYITRFNEMQEELRNSHRTAYLGQVECRVINHPGIFVGSFTNHHRIIACLTRSGPWSAALALPGAGACLVVNCCL